MQPYLAMPVLYRLRPGQTRMGQQDLAAIVTRVHKDGAVDLIAFPPQTNITDALHLDRVAPMSDTITGHCWHVAADNVGPAISALLTRIEELEVAATTKPASKQRLAS